MSLIRSTSVIGGLTLLSRLFGFVRDMLLARVLGAGLAADAYQLAFRLPNTFRRLFAEGAFSVAFVPMFARKLVEEDGDAKAERFSEDVLSVFIWVLLVFSALAIVAMPGIVWLLADDFAEVPGKFDLAVLLSRLTFPYLFFISIVSLLTGILNSRSKFGPGAFAPVLFNLTLIGGIVSGWLMRGPGGDDRVVVLVLSVAVSLSGIAQLIYLWWRVRREGFRLQIRRPRFTPDVRELGWVILPATFGAGIYQLSQLIDTYFATSLPQGSLTLLAMGDRLNQMPLGIVGIALGTAILPMLSRHIMTEDREAASRLQSNAVDLAMLLTLPAAAALWVCASPFVFSFFVGGRFTAADGAVTADIVRALVAGLPAYVLIKIFQPAFFARKDTRTPVYVAATALTFNVALILLLIEPFGIVGLAAATAGAAWLNAGLLYFLLHRRDHFRLQPWLIGRVLRQIVSTAIMAAALWWLARWLGGWFTGSILERAVAVAGLVAAGLAVYAVAGYATGALNRQRLAPLLRRGNRSGGK
ncbi:MAG TPA: murein biosynthesis integral membrane protein MurJ [Allosphingosinicella sp.]